MLNRVILIGRLVRDPETNYVGQGIPVARMRIAVDRSRRNPDTNERETDFIDLVAWRTQADFARDYLTKGRLVAVEGRLQIRSWQAQDGTRRTSAEVVVDSIQGLDRPREAQERHEAAPEPEPATLSPEDPGIELSPSGTGQTLDDEDPFADV